MKKIKGVLVVLMALSFLSACRSELKEAEGAAGEEEIAFARAREEMVKTQIKARGIEDERLLKAMLRVERHRFVPAHIRHLAYTDRPLPIGEGQTISQPYIVALMTELLKLDGHEKVLEIGTGSGYQAAILAELVQKVYTIEILKPLAKHSEKLLQDLGYKNITVKHGDGFFGWEEHAPFEAIIVTCAPPHIPQPLIDQLAEGGRMVIPVGPEWRWQDLFVVERIEGEIKKEKVAPVRFVPMTGEGVIGTEHVRQPAVSGRFYPARAQELERMVRGFLEQVQPAELNGELIALIVPHAGFVFSGQVAAYSYKQLEGRKFDTIILIGDSHRVRFPGISIGDFSAYRTPLGDVPVDKTLARKLINEHEIINFHPRAHKEEHSLEVQLPFLQIVLEDFKIVPIIMGERSLETCKILADALLEHTRDKNVLFIASTDLSHFHSYNEAIEIDKRAIAAMEKLDSELLFRGLQRNEYELCGGAATVTTMLIAEKLGADQVTLLKYANSGDVPLGDKSRVVGYAAMAITTPQQNSSEIETFESLNEEAQQILLRFARRAIEGYAVTGATPKFSPEEQAVLNEKRGVFVTIYKDGELRGCIGTHESDKPLYQLVPQMAIAAAFFDRRFPKLKEEEIGDIKIELSVYLSGLVKIDDVNQYQVGRHGIILRKGRREATFLPKVPREQGWDREETLEQLGRKAGLAPGGWRDKDVEFYIYSTQVFEE